MRASYEKDVTDEFVLPTVIGNAAGQPVARIRPGDAVIFFNFRADRARQLTHAFLDEAFDGFDRADGALGIHYATMTHYEDGLELPEAFPPVRLENLLADLVAAAGRKQLRSAETEKYPHVTFFFNGGQDAARPGEDRHLVPSPKVATYDLQPQMSAPELTAGAVDAIRSGRYDLVILNYANGDMVGHTGVLAAAIQAVETVDRSVGEIAAAILEVGGAALITADHGNCEQMWDPETDGPHTAHTTNPVPCFLVGRGFASATLRSGGRLADVAPTLLHLMGLEPSEQMTGQSLIRS
jgi:2,3-bisphosphoglycerate-independent phosphoglycerate mutase